MQWLVALEAENNPIVLGRMLNACRRKGVVINTLTLGTRKAEMSVMALVESPEESVEHVFHFLRRMVGVREVTYYRHESTGRASFVFIETDNHSSVTKVLADFPLSKMVFASQGRYLIQVGEMRDTAGRNALHSEAGLLPFARMRSTSNTAGGSRLQDA